MKRLLFILVIINQWHLLQAQVFIREGMLTFERRIQVHRLIDEAFEGMEGLKKQVPQFVTEQCRLAFSQNKTLFQPVNTDALADILNSFSVRGIVYTDQQAARYICQKEVLGKTYLVQDSLPSIEWKLTSDTRTIAGFECRKAVGKILDSLVVIAFYTTEIISGGGPESFAGLPGMILGLAIPSLHTTWYATGLQPLAPDYPVIRPPAKGQPINRTGLHQLLQEVNNSNPSRKYYNQLYAWLALI